MARHMVLRAAKSPRLAARALARTVVEFSLAKVGVLLWGLSPRRRKELARRNREGTADGKQWFSDEERRLVAVLAALIVPSDAGSPGAKDTGVVEAIGGMIVGSQPLQGLYRRGLLAFEELARREYGVAFGDVPASLQATMLERVDRQWRDVSDRSSAGRTVQGVIRTLYYQGNGLFAAIELWPRLVADVMQVFYTSPLSWTWLGYDGPPMPLGYPGLVARLSAGPHHGPGGASVRERSSSEGSE